MIYDFDGYDDYPTAQILREHVRLSGTITVEAGGRNGGNRLKCLGSSAYVCRAVPVPGLAEVTWGGYLEIAALGPITPWCVLDFRDATTSHVYIRVNLDGSVSALRANQAGDYSFDGGIVLGTTVAGLVAAAIPFHLQARVLVDDAVGEVEIAVNGTQVLNLTNQDTRFGGTATCTNVLMGNGYTGAYTVYLDDMYLADDLVGDRRVDSHYPIEDGVNQDGVPSAVGAHYLMVDEISPDDDATFVTLNAAGERESYGCEDFKNPGVPIDAVMVVVDAKKTDAGAATLSTHIHGAGSPGADYDGTAQGVTTDWARYKQVYETDPDSGSPAAAWDEAAFNAAEYGDKKVA